MKIGSPALMTVPSSLLRSTTMASNGAVSVCARAMIFSSATSACASASCALATSTSLSATDSICLGHIFVALRLLGWSARIQYCARQAPSCAGWIPASARALRVPSRDWLCLSGRRLGVQHASARALATFASCSVACRRASTSPLLDPDRHGRPSARPAQRRPRSRSLRRRWASTVPRPNTRTGTFFSIDATRTATGRLERTKNPALPTARTAIAAMTSLPVGLRMAVPSQDLRCHVCVRTGAVCGVVLVARSTGTSIVTTLPVSRAGSGDQLPRALPPDRCPTI